MSMTIPPARNTPVRTTEAAEGRGPDTVRDGDADDRAAAATKAPAAAGTGRLVDRTV